MHSSMMRAARLLPISPSMHCSQRCLVLGGVYSGGWCLVWEVVSQHALRQTPPNRITDTCENITLPRLRCGR